MPDAVNALAKAAVGALIKADPSALAVAGGAEAVSWLIDRLPGREKTAYDRLLGSVTAEVERLPAHEFGSAESKAAALGNATTLLEAYGLGASDLVELNLAPARAADELLRRGATVLGTAGEPVAGLVRRRIVPAIYRGLLQDSQHIETLKPAIFQALLAQRDLIRVLPDQVGAALRGLFGRYLVTDPTEAWRPSLPDIYLLRAEYGVVRFHEQRRPEVERLLAWCEEGTALAVRLITGPGGTGKTRLMIELCEQARRRGWRAGFLHRETPPAPSWELGGLQGGEQALLLVVDYAETKRDVLVPVLRRLALAPAGGPVRVVLLAREVADWWRELQEADPELQELLDDALVPVERLPSIAEPLDQRRGVLEAAATAFADKLGLAAPQIGEADLSARHFANALFLHIAGLAAAVGDPAKEEDALLRFVLIRERRHWRAGLDGEQLAGDVDALTVAQALALLTLAGGVDGKAAARSLLERAPKLAGLVPPKRDRLIDLLHRLYPGERYLEPIRPDLLGEHLVDEALADDPSLLAAALAIAGETPLTVLTRLAKRRSEARRWLEQGFAMELERLAEPALNVAIETGDPIGPVLAGALAARTERGALLEYGQLGRLEAEIPDQTTSLREVATAVMTQMRASLCQNPGPWPEDLQVEVARVANNLAPRLSDLGRREDALAAAEEAVRLRRTLAAARPDAFTPDLASSLNNLANHLSDLGRREDALDAAEEARDLYRALAAARPDAFTPDLASSLNNLAPRLSDLGRREDALAAAEEARDLYRALAAARPDAFTPDLAGSLNNLANFLSALGRREDALAAAAEARDLYRALAAARPDAFTPDLAMSLNNLANRLSDLGRREDALAAAEEARDLYRALAAARPDAFTPNLATSLNNLANRLSALGRREDALAAAEEAVRLRRTLAAARPDAFTPDLAMSLNNLASFLGALGRREDALAAAEEAVRLRRTLAAARPDAFTPNLAGSLSNLANGLSDLGRREDALAAAEEARDLYRALAAARPDAFTPDLAGSLNNLANCLSDLGRREDALAAAEEARDLYRALAAARPDAFTPDLASSLNNLANCLSDLGRREDALAAAEEAVRLRRTLAAARSDAFTPNLALSLAVLANCLEAVERASDALDANREAIAALRAPFLARPAAFAHWMVPMCQQYIERCEALGREPDAGLLGPVEELLRQMGDECGPDGETEGG